MVQVSATILIIDPKRTSKLFLSEREDGMIVLCIAHIHKYDIIFDSVYDNEPCNTIDSTSFSQMKTKIPDGRWC